MAEAWDLVPDTERTANEVVTFIVFSEDGVCEPYYLRQFQKPGKVKINVTGDQYSGFRNFTQTLVHCSDLDLLEAHEGGFKLKQDTTPHVWCVFDRDVDVTSSPEQSKTADIAFSQSIKACHDSGINVAWSNDAFELWILLHFEDVTAGQSIRRTYLYERLTAIFKALPGQPAPMAALTSNARFDYKHSFKKRTEFNLYVLPFLAGKHKDAEQRAVALEAAFNHTHAFHQRNPCTKIHHLVNSILSFH